MKSIYLVIDRRNSQFPELGVSILLGGHLPEQQVPLVWLGGGGVLQLELQGQTEQGPHAQVSCNMCPF